MKDSRYFDRSNLILRPLSERKHELTLSCFKALDDTNKSEHGFEGIDMISDRIITAKRSNKPIILMMGAHVIRSGVQNYLIDLMKRGYISCISLNGAGLIHDFEFALIGATTENVNHYIAQGQFGLWTETGRINHIINETYSENLGIGESIGREIFNGQYQYKAHSIFAQAYKYSIPVTVHVGIGQDIIHEHPNFNAAATGDASYRDFLKLTRIIQNLEGGVVMNFGSAVMAPEVFLKSLSMARNVAIQNGKTISKFSTLVCDLHDLPVNPREEAPKSSSFYYFRPWKTMLVRTVADGGSGYYAQGRHESTVPYLWKKLLEKDLG